MGLPLFLEAGKKEHIHQEKKGGVFWAWENGGAEYACKNRAPAVSVLLMGVDVIRSFAQKIF
jgi:hypothetical protein